MYSAENRTYSIWPNLRKLIHHNIHKFIFHNWIEILYIGIYENCCAVFVRNVSRYPKWTWREPYKSYFSKFQFGLHLGKITALLQEILWRFAIICWCKRLILNYNYHQISLPVILSVVWFIFSDTSCSLGDDVVDGPFFAVLLVWTFFSCCRKMLYGKGESPASIWDWRKEFGYINI